MIKTPVCNNHLRLPFAVHLAEGGVILSLVRTLCYHLCPSPSHPKEVAFGNLNVVRAIVVYLNATAAFIQKT